MLKVIYKNNSEKRKPAGFDPQKWLNRTVKLLKNGMEIPKKGIIEFYLVDPDRIKKLNKEFREKDKETDVLSFGFIGQQSFPGDDLVGQIFLCPQIAQKQASEHLVSYREETEFLTVHAFLHVFGLDHEKPGDFKKMFDWQLKLFPQAKWRDYVRLIYREAFLQ